MKWIMRLFGLLGALLLIVVIVGVYLVVTFDPNAYKTRIEDTVTQAIGRELTLAGSIDLTLFPSLGLRLEDARLANAEGFDTQPFAELRVIDVAVAVLPLIRGEIEVQRIMADGVSLHLARDAAGRSNWDDLLERLESARSEAAPGGPVNSGSGRSRIALDDLAIAGLEVTHLRVDWDDRQAGTRMRLEPANLHVRDFRPGFEAPVKLDFSARIEGQDAAPVALDLELDALLNADPVANRYALRRIRSDLELLHPAFEPPVAGRLEADLVVDLHEAVARIERLSARLSDLHLTGLFVLHGLGEEKPTLQAELRSNTFNLREVLASLGLASPKTTDPSALTLMALDLTAAGGLDRIEVNPFLLTLDDSSLRGEAALDRSGPRPMLRFDLAGDRLDLDRYLPPEVEEVRTAESPPPEAPKKDVPIELPAELMRAFDLDGRLRLDQLRLLGLALERIEMQLRARDGEWRMEPLTGSGYQGRMEARVTVDARRETPRYAAAVDLRDVAIAPLLEALWEEESRLVGTGNLAWDVNAAGESVDALTRSLSGRGEMLFRDGAVRGINVARIIRHADARLRGEPPLDDGEPNATDFTELKGSFQIRDGVVRNEDLLANSPLLRVAGRGSADLPRQQLEYRVDTTLVATIEGQGGRSLDELRGVNLPIRITGAFAEPRFRLDLEDVVRERVDERVRREADRLQQRLLERLGVGEGDGGSQEAAPERSEPRRLEDQLDRLRRSLR